MCSDPLPTAEEVQLAPSCNLLTFQAHRPAFSPTEPAGLTHSKFTCARKELLRTCWEWEERLRPPKHVYGSHIRLRRAFSTISPEALGNGSIGQVFIG